MIEQVFNPFEEISDSKINPLFLIIVLITLAILFYVSTNENGYEKLKDKVKSIIGFISGT